MQKASLKRLTQVNAASGCNDEFVQSVQGADDNLFTVFIFSLPVFVFFAQAEWRGALDVMLQLPSP